MASDVSKLKDVLTTGQVARICRVTIRTVIKWFESGRIKGYKIPESKDRRIPRENLRVFLVENGIPHDPELFDARRKLLVADDDQILLESLTELFSDIEGLILETASSGYEAGFKTAQVRPDVLLLDYNLGDITATEVLETLEKHQMVERTRIIVMTGFLGDEAIGGLEKDGFRVVRKPFDFIELRDEVLGLLSLAQ